MSVKFTTSRVILAGLVARAAPVVPSGNFRPVLRNFQVTISPQQLRLDATDLDLAMSVTSSSVTTADEAVFLLPAARLVAILKEAPEGSVTVEVDGSTAVLTAGPAEWALRLDPGEYPVLPDLSEAVFTQADREPLLAALRTVRQAVPPDSVSPAQACVVVARQGDGTAKVTAHSSSRFQQCLLGAFPHSLLIPALGTPCAVDEVMRLLAVADSLPQVDVAGAGAWTAIRAGSATFAFKSPSSKPADSGRLLQVIGANTARLEVAKDALVSAIRQVRITADEKTSAIVLGLEPAQVTVSSQDMFENGAHVQVAATWGGKLRSVTVHHKFLLEMLAVHPASMCRFYLAPAKGSPILLRDEESGVTGIINQLRVGSTGAG